MSPNLKIGTNGIRGHSDSGGASRFFYVAKASKAEREAGLNAPPGERGNIHATVKPITLMRYLVRLVTQPGGVVLDPFMGSGSTGCAAMLEAMQFIGIELNQEYVEIARKRIEFHEYTVREKNPMGL
jgi:site-specific DNA-methyltransferase (adenine-specific)